MFTLIFRKKNKFLIYINNIVVCLFFNEIDLMKKLHLLVISSK